MGEPRSLTFVVPGEPVPKARAVVPRRGKPFTPEKTRLAEEAVGWEARREYALSIAGGLWWQVDAASRYGLLVRAYCKSKRTLNSDEDNFLKLVQDALEGIV
ncbi:hypothetical protein LCGC14_2021740, partial [marine sediment metagenome]